MEKQGSHMYVSYRPAVVLQKYQKNTPVPHGRKNRGTVLALWRWERSGANVSVRALEIRWDALRHTTASKPFRIRAVIDRHTRERGVWFVRCVCRELPPLYFAAIEYCAAINIAQNKYACNPRKPPSEACNIYLKIRAREGILAPCAGATIYVLQVARVGAIRYLPGRHLRKTTVGACGEWKGGFDRAMFGD